MDPFSSEGQKYSQELIDGFTYSWGKRYLEAVFNAICSGIEHVYLNRVEGDIAEFGTGFGMTAKFLAYLNKEIAGGNEIRGLHFFDTFLGLPEYTSDHDKQTDWKPGDFKAASKEDILSIAEEYIDKHKIYIRRIVR